MNSNNTKYYGNCRCWCHQNSSDIHSCEHCNTTSIEEMVKHYRKRWTTEVTGDWELEFAELSEDLISQAYTQGVTDGRKQALESNQ